MSMEKAECYVTYKNSGVAWMGEIPEHWKFVRIKDLISKITSGVTPRGGAESYEDVGIPFLRSQNVHNDGLRLDDVSFISEKTHLEMLNSQVKPGDIIFNITGASIARTCIVPETIKTANINQHIALLRLRKFNEIKFISYYLQSQLVKDYVYLTQNGASKEAFNHGQMKCIPVSLPMRSEQTAIVVYLDTKTSQIDRKIDFLSQKAVQYNKLKQSLINETVINGLDKSVSMKDSGVAWIGKIPEHWDVKRLKEIGYLYSGLSGKSGGDFTDDNINSAPFIPFTNIANNFYLSIQELNYVIIRSDEKQNTIKKDDLFFLMSSEDFADLGKSSLLLENPELPTYLNSFCKGFRFIKKCVDPRFINYLLHSSGCRAALSNEGRGFTRINLRMNKINDIALCLPTKFEQTTIANYLDEKSAQIDRIVTTINTQIDLLKELRKALINDVVTGKIKVINQG